MEYSWFTMLFSFQVYSKWHPTPVLLPGKSHGWRSLVGRSPWGHWGSDMTERLHFQFSLSCTGEGNGSNPLQCSCLENPRDRGAWWEPSLESHRVGHDWSDLAAAAADSSVGKQYACNGGDPSSIPGLGRSPGEVKGYLLQYSGLENSIDCIVLRVAKSWTWLSDFLFTSLQF